MKFYRELITECIPLFVAAGLIAALCSTVSLAGVSYLNEEIGRASCRERV